MATADQVKALIRSHADGDDTERLTRQSAYWYSVWSHRRNQLWKGFVQVALAPAEDTVAAATLASLTIAGGRP